MTRSKKTLSGAASLDKTLKKLNRYREQYNPLSNLTIPRARALVESFVRGEYADLMWTFGAPFMGVETADSNVRALIERRVSPLMEMDWVIKSTTKERKRAIPGFEKMAAEQESFAWDLVERIENLYEAVEHMAMAAFRGFAHCEIERDATGGILRFIVIEQWNIVRDGVNGDWKYNPAAQNTGFDHLPAEYLIDPNQFLIAQSKRPIHRVALINFILRQMAMKDWAAFIEIYGIPGGVVIGPPNVPADRETEFEQAAMDLVEGGKGYLPNGSDYKINESPRGTNPFSEYVKTLSEEIILAGTAGKLTMLAESGSGTLAGGAHQETFDKIVKGEARKISEIFQKQIISKALQERFPGQPELVYFELASNEETDTSEFVNDVATLSTAGYQVAPDQVEEKTGYKVSIKEVPASSAGTAADFKAPVKPAANRITEADKSGFTKDLARAQSQSLDPIEARIQELLKIGDPADLESQANALKADLPSILKELNIDTETASIYEEIIGTVLAESLVEDFRGVQ